MSRSKNRKIADLISGGTFDDGVVAASEVTGLHSVASTGNFNELENKPAPFDPATLASVAVSGSFNDLSDQPTPFDPSTLGTASTQATGAFATAAQGAKADAALPKSGGAVTGNVTFGHNDRAVFGVSGNALEVFHDGSNKYIADVGSGSLFIRGSDLVLEDAGGNDYITMNDAGTGGTVTLKHNSSSKLATTSTGVDVTGTVNADALTGVGSIDATTAAAIGAAGVGGNTEFLGTVSFGSTASAYDISLPSGYRAHKLIGHGPRGNGYASRPIYRLSNSSGSIITSNVYNYAGFGHDASGRGGYSQYAFKSDFEAWASDHQEAFSIINIDILFARDSSKETAIIYEGYCAYNAGYSRGFSGGGHIQGAADNIKFRIQTLSDTFLGDSTKMCYLYGIK